MRRRLFTIASLLSLILWAGTVVLWVRSYSNQEVLFIGNTFIVESHNGAVTYQEGQRNASAPQFFVTSLAPQLIVPYIFISPLILLACILFYGARGDHKTSGLCPECGYNLTGNTSGICPECGTADSVESTS
ncbi:MAG TPA: hypothetical protein VIM11_10565 [Tepidisphaeraceae bacterium]